MSDHEYRQQRTSETPTVQTPRALDSVSNEAAREELTPVSEAPSHLPQSAPVDPVAAAQLKIEAGRARLEEQQAQGESGSSGGETLAAIAAQSATLTEVLGTLSVEEQAEFMATDGSSVAAGLLKSALETGDADLIERVVSDLTRAGETLGQDNIESLAGPLVAALGAENPYDTGSADRGPVLRALESSIMQGDGALLGAALSGRNAALFGSFVDRPVAALTANFQGSSKEVADLRRSMLGTRERMRNAGLSEEEISAWEDGFREENQEAFDRFETAAEFYGGTLNGQAYAAKSSSNLDAGKYRQRLGLVDELAYSQAGGQVVAEALLQSGRGETTWLDSIDTSREDLNQPVVEYLITQGAMQGIGALSSTGDLETLDVFLKGVELQVPSGDGQAVAAIRERIQGFSGENLSGEKLREELNGAFGATSDLTPAQQDLVERLGLGAKLGRFAGSAGSTASAVEAGAEFRGRSLPGVGRMGDAFSRLGSGLQLLTAQEDFDRGMAAADLGLDAAKMLKLVGTRANLAVGAAFSLVDGGRYLLNGDTEAAAVALLPAIGAVIGGAIGSLGFGAGAVPGAAAGIAVGSAASAGLSMMGVGEVDSIRPIAVPAIRDALEARGLVPQVAQQLASRFGDDPSFGLKFEAAANHLQIPTAELMTRLSDADYRYRDEFLNQVESKVTLLDGLEGDRSAEDTEGWRSFQEFMLERPPGSAESNTVDLYGGFLSMARDMGANAGVDPFE